MSDGMNSNTLIDSVKNRAHIPENQATFEAEDFLSFATEELHLGLVPMIMSLHEDYFLHEVDIPLESGKREYAIPSRAMGNKLKDVQFKLRDNSFIEMTRVSIGDRFGDFDSLSNRNLKRFYIKGNKIVLLDDPPDSSGNYLTFVFFMRPSKLVTEDRIGVISGINRTTGEIVLDEVPEFFSTQLKFDFYKTTSPYMNIKMDFSLTSLNVLNNTVTVDPSTIPDDLEIGDHIALSGEAFIPQIPAEMHPMLAQMIACRLLESQGDAQGLQTALVKLQQMQESSGVILDNRVDESPRKVTNRYSTLRNSTFGKRINRR